MKFMKFLVCINAIALIYVIRENYTLKDRIVDSAEAVSQSIKKIEHLSDELSESQTKGYACFSTLNKYREQIEAQRLEN